MSELYESRFEAIGEDFDNQLSLLEHLTNTYSNSLDEIEERGYMGGDALYRAMQDVERQNIGILQQEYADLVQAMSDAVNSGAIEKYSASWYEMQQQIFDVTEAIQESNMQLLEYENTLRQLKWDRFDYLQDRISQVTKEADFLNDLLSEQDLYEDNGQFNEYGEAAMGLHGVNYNAYMAQADMYAEELKAVSQELANDPYNTVLVERYEELLGLQQDAIRSASEEKSAIKSLVEDGINRELESVQDLIDAREEELDRAQDLYELNKKIKSQTSSVAALQKQLAAYEGDNSEENRARVQELRTQLADAEEELEETQRDAYIDDQKQMLDDLYTSYEETLNKRLDDLDSLISDMIDRINSNADGIRDTLMAGADKVGYTLSDAMSSIWSVDGDFTGVITKYGDGFLNAMTSLNDALGRIEGYVSSMVQSGDSIASDSIGSASSQTETNPNPGPNTPNVPGSGSQNSAGSDKDMIEVVTAQAGINTKSNATGTRIGIAKKGDVFEYLGKTRDSRYKIMYNGQVGWIRQDKSKLVPKTVGYSTGGIVGGMEEIARANGDDVVTINTLKKGEAVLTPNQAQMFSKFTNYLPQLSGIVDTSGRFRGISAPQGNSGMSIGNVSFNIPIDHVENYDDFVRQIQHDDKFEKLIQSMTLDRMTGGGKLSKYKVKW